MKLCAAALALAASLHALAQPIEMRTDPAARYAFIRDAAYGYESIDNRSMVMIRYFGTRDGSVQWGAPEAGYIDVFECSGACTFVRMRRWSWRGSGFLLDRTFRVPANTVTADILADIKAGRLQVGTRCWASENYLTC